MTYYVNISREQLDDVLQQYNSSISQILLENGFTQQYYAEQAQIIEEEPPEIIYHAPKKPRKAEIIPIHDFSNSMPISERRRNNLDMIVEMSDQIEKRKKEKEEAKQNNVPILEEIKAVSTYRKGPAKIRKIPVFFPKRMLPIIEVKIEKETGPILLSRDCFNNAYNIKQKKKFLMAPVTLSSTESEKRIDKIALQEEALEKREQEIERASNYRDKKKRMLAKLKPNKKMTYRSKYLKNISEKFVIPIIKPLISTAYPEDTKPIIKIAPSRDDDVIILNNPYLSDPKKILEFDIERLEKIKEIFADRMPMKMLEPPKEMKEMKEIKEDRTYLKEFKMEPDTKEIKEIKETKPILTITLTRIKGVKLGLLISTDEEIDNSSLKSILESHEYSDHNIMTMSAKYDPNSMFYPNEKNIIAHLKRLVTAPQNSACFFSFAGEYTSCISSLLCKTSGSICLTAIFDFQIDETAFQLPYIYSMEAGEVKQNRINMTNPKRTMGKVVIISLSRQSKSNKKLLTRQLLKILATDEITNDISYKDLLAKLHYNLKLHKQTPQIASNKELNMNDTLMSSHDVIQLEQPQQLEQFKENPLEKFFL